MEIPIHAEVWCTDGRCGRSDELIVNPATKQVTHIVVKEGQGLHEERLVPVDRVAETSPERITLDCSKEALGRMDDFIDRQYVPLWPNGPFPEGSEPGIAVLSQELVPEGETTIHGGAHVEAADGHVGRVYGLLVDRARGRITHLVLREGFLLGRKELTIPVAQIDHIEAERIYLKLDKHAVAELPAVPLHGHGA